jgi:hypothetical protein
MGFRATMKGRTGDLDSEVPERVLNSPAPAALPSALLPATIARVALLKEVRPVGLL